MNPEMYPLAVGYCLIASLLLLSFFARPMPNENWHLIYYSNREVTIRHIESVRSEEQCIRQAHEVAIKTGDPYMRKSKFSCGKNPRELKGEAPKDPAKVVGGYEYDIILENE